MSTAMTVPQSADIERVLIGGDLARLTPDQRVMYYNNVCNSIGLNPLTRPFDYIVLNGKTVLYARKDCADQLRALKGVSIPRIEQVETEGLYVVTAYAVMPNGRQDADTGAVNIATLKGDARANAIMKATTKAKRRVTLSICGLGFLDENEVETIPGAYRVVVDEAGTIKGPQEGTREAQQAIVDEALRHEPPATVHGIEDRQAQRDADALAELNKIAVPLEPREEAPKSTAKPRKATPPPAVSFNMLEVFADMKKKFSEVSGERVTDNAPRLYYEILKQYGYSKSNQIPNRERGLAVHKSMKDALIAAKTHKANCEELSEIGAKCAANEELLKKFWQVMGAHSFPELQDAKDSPDQLPALLEELRGIV